jgi:hypothetical protein
VCFGKIRWDATIMRFVLDTIEGSDGSAGAIIGDQDPLESLEHLMVVGKPKPKSNECGPMFWAFRRAVSRVVGEAAVQCDA